MVGFRVFDVGLLIVWLVWFFRLRDDEGPADDEGPGGGGPDPGPEDGPGGGGLRLPLGPVKPGRRRRARPSPPRRPPGRGAEPIPRPLPARVRQPRSPVPAHHRA